MEKALKRFKRSGNPTPHILKSSSLFNLSNAADQGLLPDETQEDCVENKPILPDNISVTWGTPRPGANPKYF